MPIFAPAAVFSAIDRIAVLPSVKTGAVFVGVSGSGSTGGGSIGGGSIGGGSGSGSTGGGSTGGGSTGLRVVLQGVVWS